MLNKAAKQLTLIKYLGLVFLAIGTGFSLFGSFEVFFVFFVAGLVFVLVGNDLLSDLTFFNVKATIREAELINQSTFKLVQVVSKVAIDVMGKIGRIGVAPTISDKEVLRSEIEDLLVEIGVGKKDLKKLFSDYFAQESFDYAYALLGGSSFMMQFRGRALQEIKVFRSVLSLKNIPTPEQIESFFKDNNLLSSEIQGYINDYKYYVKNKEHRRPELAEHEVKSTWLRSLPSNVEPLDVLLTEDFEDIVLEKYGLKRLETKI